MLTFPGCKNAFACFLGELLGAMVDSWTRPYFMLLGILAFLLAMLIGRWRSAALLGLAVAIFPLSILFVALTPREAVSVQLTGPHRKQQKLEGGHPRDSRWKAKLIQNRLG
jgi:hypothetical protein